MIYCMSDLHGQYQQFKKLLNLIDFDENDTLYILGDIVDRGPESLKIIEDIKNNENIHPLIGNHEYNMMLCANFLLKEITESSVKELENNQLDLIVDWFSNGGKTTFLEFMQYSKEQQKDILDYIGEFTLYEEVEVNGNNFVLTHAGISNFSIDKPLEDYSLFDMIFTRPNYEKVYYPNKYLVSGHTPTPLIDENCKDGSIYFKNNHIAIDCGSVFGGRLGVICLDTFETFYVR